LFGIFGVILQKLKIKIMSKIEQSEIIDKYADQEVLSNVFVIPDEYFTNPEKQHDKVFVLETPPILKKLGYTEKKLLLMKSIFK
jgi:hypothetical protein